MTTTRIALSLATLVASIMCATVSGGDKKGVVVDLGGLKSEAPADWKQQKPAFKLRVYQFALPGEEKNAELAIFYFDGGGGSVDANLKRWKDRMIAPKGKSIEDVSKVENFKVGEAEAWYLDVSGTYLERPPAQPNAQPVRRENYRFFGVYFNHEKGPHFITLTGPADTVERHKKAFERWLKNFK